MLFSFRRLFVCKDTQRCSTQIDLWAHPDLSRMSQRELADLPFPRHADINPDEGNAPCGLHRKGTPDE
jgi:hypothetical protein